MNESNASRLLRGVEGFAEVSIRGISVGFLVAVGRDLSEEDGVSGIEIFSNAVSVGRGVACTYIFTKRSTWLQERVRRIARSKRIVHIAFVLYDVDITYPIKKSQTN